MKQQQPPRFPGATFFPSAAPDSDCPRKPRLRSRRQVLAGMAVLLGLTVAVSGCGRRGPLKPPADVDPAYPRSYPKPQ